MKKWYSLLLVILISACTPGNEEEIEERISLPNQFVVVLGIAQDAGFPQANCYKECCLNSKKIELVSSLGVVDRVHQKIWILDASPDFKEQLGHLQSYLDSPDQLPSGIFLTHAHMGHYTGLTHLGREAIGSDNVTVCTMPRMRSFLESNGPWSQLVELGNIKIMDLSPNEEFILSNTISIEPFLVPHRDEFSETVGYKINGPNTKVLFIPDIDKWNRWETDITQEIEDVDVAFLDGTFYENGELPNRDMTVIPHPFIEESIAVFDELSLENKEKVHFTHLNHTNPLLRKNSIEYKEFRKLGFSLAQTGQIIPLN